MHIIYQHRTKVKKNLYGNIIPQNNFIKKAVDNILFCVIVWFDMNLTESLSLLELEYGFSEQDLKAAYRKMARRYHPDIIGDASNEKMTQINMAYNICRAQIGETENVHQESDIWNIVAGKYDKMFENIFANTDKVYEQMFKDKFAEFDFLYAKQKTR